MAHILFYSELNSVCNVMQVIFCSFSHAVTSGSDITPCTRIKKAKKKKQGLTDLVTLCNESQNNVHN